MRNFICNRLVTGKFKEEVINEEKDIVIIYDVEKLEKSSDPDCLYTGEVVRYMDKETNQELVGYVLKKQLLASKQIPDAENVRQEGFRRLLNHYKCPCGHGGLLMDFYYNPRFSLNHGLYVCEKCGDNMSFVVSPDESSWDLVEVEQQKVDDTEKLFEELA